MKLLIDKQVGEWIYICKGPVNKIFLGEKKAEQGIFLRNCILDTTEENQGNLKELE